jgi:hypothetical protein
MDRPPPVLLNETQPPDLSPPLHADHALSNLIAPTAQSGTAPRPAGQLRFSPRWFSTGAGGSLFNGRPQRTPPSQAQIHARCAATRRTGQEGPISIADRTPVSASEPGCDHQRQARRSRLTYVGRTFFAQAGLGAMRTPRRGRAAGAITAEMWLQRGLSLVADLVVVGVDECLGSVAFLHPRSQPCSRR